MDKELKEKIKKATEEIIAEEKLKKKFIRDNLDGNYLQYMINRCDANPNLVIELEMKEGTKITIYTKKEVQNGVAVFNDIISPEDVR